MATVSAAGISARSLTSYREMLEERFRAAYGDGVSVAPETPLGGLIGIMALSLREMDEALVSVANGFSPDYAVGRQLEDLAALVGIRRIPAQRTTVSCALTGTANALIPLHAVAKTADGKEFRASTAITLSSAGTGQGTFEAVEPGPVELAADALTQIVSLTPGWATITNAAAGVLGRNRESDSALRGRLRRTVAREGLGTRDAIMAALFEAGASRVRLEENTTAAAVMRQGKSIPAHAIMAVVEGGVDADIGEALLRSKALGIAMAGGTTGTGSAGAWAFERVVLVPLSVTMTILTDTDFPADGLAGIKANLALYLSALGIGESVDTARLSNAALAVGGYTQSAFAVVIKTGNAALPATTPLERRYTLVAADVTITVS